MSGKVEFLSSMRPVLPQGSYRLTAEHAVAALGSATPPYRNAIEFHVGEPVRALLPTDLHSVYPPKGASGAFEGHLPHIVLMRPTLPWDMSLTDAPRSETDEASAIALLVIGAGDEGAVDIRNVDGRREITFDGALFRRIAPTADDLNWIAHVRRVDTGAKETPFFMSDGTFAVVLANRFPETPDPARPKATGRNHAVLVSLAGKKDLLAADAASKPKTSEPTVTLDLLADWQFSSTGEAGLAGEAAALSGGPYAIPLAAPAGDEDAEQAHVRDAFAKGYCPLPHAMRHGDRTVSWYRGPLTPVDYAGPDAQTVFRGSPDAALRYDPQDGMFDTSYAAAFQLGRLLALQDKGFATAMRRFRDTVRADMNALAGRKMTGGLLGGDIGQSERRQMAEALAKGDAPVPKTDRYSGGVWLPGGKDGQEKTGVALDPPAEVSRWLARLMLLYRVPYDYLVPDARLLPDRSLRFFQVDPNWLKCLLEGACSVGRVTSGDQMIDEWIRARFLDTALADAPDVRSRAPEAEPKIAPAAKGTQPDAVKKQRQVALKWPLSGFLMKSPLVAHWNGLEMHAKIGETPALPLRIDRIAPDTLICIFDGALSEVEIRPPAEAVYHGAEKGPGGYFKSVLRDPVTGAPHRKEAPGFRVPMRGADGRVIDMPRLGKGLASLAKASPSFGSGDLALQLTEAAQTIVRWVKAP